MNIDRIGLQLYTVRDHTARDMLGALRSVAQMGYRAVELAGYGNATLHDIRATLDEQNMRAIAAHVRLDALEAKPEQTLAELAELGCRYAVVPYVGEERRGNLEQVRQLADVFNRLGEQCRAEGLQFVYHNHAFEFAPLDGTTMFDLLLEATDPALVAFELDVYWAQYAGVDPVGLIPRLSGRLPLIHVKDMAADDSRADLPVGDGMLPWPEIFRAGAAAGTEWYIVEQDHPRDPLADVERSLRNLEQMSAGAR